MFRATAVLLLVLGAAACSQSSDVKAFPEDAVVTYRFHDSSVPPEYHRSFTLTATREQSRIVVDSYGDVLADATVATSSAAWDQLAQTFGEVADLTVESADQGCTGGTSADLEIDSGSGRILDLSPQFCGDVNVALEQAFESWIAPVRDQFPSTDVLAPETQ